LILRPFFSLALGATPLRSGCHFPRQLLIELFVVANFNWKNLYRWCHSLPRRNCLPPHKSLSSPSTQIHDPLITFITLDHALPMRHLFLEFFFLDFPFLARPSWSDLSLPRFFSGFHSPPSLCAPLEDPIRLTALDYGHSLTWKSFPVNPAAAFRVLFFPTPPHIS